MIRRGEDDLPETYENSLELWRQAKKKRRQRRTEKTGGGEYLTGNPNYFIPICDVEKYLRKNHLSMVFNTSALYGNIETKRVYSWSEGTIGPMNSLLNIAGARLRYLAMTRYPFPRPTTVMVERTDRNGNTYSRWHFAYGGSTRHPTVIVTHPHLPALDFVDLIRGHLVELCRQCFILSVPSKDAVRYINLLIFRLRPHLDHIYKGAIERRKVMVGTDAFVIKAERELDWVIRMIRGAYGTRAGRPERMTHLIRPTYVDSLDVSELLEDISGSTRQNNFKRLMKKGLVDDTDAKRFIDHLVNSSAGVGNRAHKRMSWGMVNPSTLRSVMLGGDYVARNKSGYIHAAEVPVLSGRGRADYVLFVRRATSVENMRSVTPGVWCPMFVLDLKTKSAYDWGVVGKSKHSDGPVRVDFRLKRRRLTDDEWVQAIGNTPSQPEIKQVNSYADALLQEYLDMAQEDPEPPMIHIRAIVLTDGTEFPSRVRRLLPGFITRIYESVRSDLILIRKKKRTGKRVDYPRSLFELDLTWPVKTRLAVVVFPFQMSPDETPEALLPLPSPLPMPSTLDPFENRTEDSRHFVLYVTAATVSSPGDTAGWVAKYWHGLEYARQVAKERKCERVIWVDLAGEFADATIRRAAFRLDSRQKKVREFHDGIEFIDLSSSIEETLFRGAAVPSVDSLREKVDGHDQVIVSGIDSIRSMTPSDIGGLVDTLVVHLTEATAIPDSTTIWFDAPMPLPTTSGLYKQHQFRPFRFDSPLQTHVDEIVLNLAQPPASGSSEVSRADHARGILRVTPDKSKGLDVSPVGVPPLFGWAKRFRSLRVFASRKTCRGRLGEELGSDLHPPRSVEVPNFTTEMAVELFPFLESWASGEVSSHTEASVTDKNIASLKVKRRKLTTRDRTRGYRGLLSRLAFSRELCKTTGKRTHPISAIDTKKKYWNPKLKLEPLETVPLPPHETDLRFVGYSRTSAEAIELRRLQTVREFLLADKWEYSPCLEFADDFVKMLGDAVKPEQGRRMTEVIQDFFRIHPYSAEVWRRIAWYRDSLNGWPMPSKMRERLTKLCVENKDILLEYGNYLLMLLAVLWEGPYPKQMELQELWDMLRPWVTLQLGTQRLSEALPKPEFDTEAIYEQMTRRMRYYRESRAPGTVPLTNMRYGITVDIDQTGSNGYRWYIFERAPYDSELVAGCVKRPEEDFLGLRKRLKANTLIPLDELGMLAERGLLIGQPNAILIANHRGSDILYESEYRWKGEDVLRSGYDYANVDWTPIGAVRYGTRHRGALARLRYINVANPGWNLMFPSISNQCLPRRSLSLGKHMFDHLSKIRVQVSQVVRVRCRVSGKTTEGRIEFYEGAGRQAKRAGEAIKYQGVHQVVRVLREPYDVGRPYGQNLTWDPLTDIEYGPGLVGIEKDVTVKIRLEERSDRS